MGNKVIYVKSNGAVASIYINLSEIWVLVASRPVLKAVSCVHDLSLTNWIHEPCSHVFASFSSVEP